MKVGVNLVTGLDMFLSCWKSSDDPAMGEYSLKIKPSGYPQLVQTKGSVVVTRAGPWNGISFSGFPSPMTIYSIDFVVNDEEIYYQFKMTDTSLFSIYKTITFGSGKVLVWTSQTRTQVKDTPTEIADQCEIYAFCGSNSICHLDGNAPTCECLKAYVSKVPKQWNMSDWSSGCVRKSALDCNSTDGFLSYRNMKLPDTSSSTYNKTMNIEECRESCLKNCSCTAYANMDIRNGGSGCLLWFGHLIDVRMFSKGGQDLYIKVPGSEDDLMQDMKKQNRYDRLQAKLKETGFMGPRSILPVNPASGGASGSTSTAVVPPASSTMPRPTSSVAPPVISSTLPLSGSSTVPPTAAAPINISFDGTRRDGGSKKAISLDGEELVPDDPSADLQKKRKRKHSEKDAGRSKRPEKDAEPFVGANTSGSGSARSGQSNPIGEAFPKGFNFRAALDAGMTSPSVRKALAPVPSENLVATGYEFACTATACLQAWEEAGMVVENKESKAIVDKSIWGRLMATTQVVLGIAMICIVAQPLMESVRKFSNILGVHTGFISFVLLPLAINAREATTAIKKASYKNSRTVSLAISEICGEVFMNNIVGFFAISIMMYVRQVSYVSSSELVVATLFCEIISISLSCRSTFSPWSSLYAYFAYLFSLLWIFCV